MKKYSRILQGVFIQCVQGIMFFMARELAGAKFKCVPGERKELPEEDESFIGCPFRESHP